MLQFFDILLTIVHLLVIGFNLFGWIWPKTRRAHLVCVLLTAASWLVLGIWFGWGYCPITDWQWDVKEKLGETNLPNSFVKYYTDKLTGKEFASGFIDTVTAVSFAAAGLLSLYVNFFLKRRVTSQA